MLLLPTEKAPMHISSLRLRNRLLLLASLQFFKQASNAYSISSKAASRRLAANIGTSISQKV